MDGKWLAGFGLGVFGLFTTVTLQIISVHERIARMEVRLDTNHTVMTTYLSDVRTMQAEQQQMRDRIYRLERELSIYSGDSSNN